MDGRDVEGEFGGGDVVGYVRVGEVAAGEVEEGAALAVGNFVSQSSSHIPDTRVLTLLVAVLVENFLRGFKVDQTLADGSILGAQLLDNLQGMRFGGVLALEDFVVGRHGE